MKTQEARRISLDHFNVEEIAWYKLYPTEAAYTDDAGNTSIWTLNQLGQSDYMVISRKSDAEQFNFAFSGSWADCTGEAEYRRREMGQDCKILKFKKV